MHSRLVVLLGTVGVGALLWSCTEDPTSSLAGGRARVGLEFGYAEVLIADSVKTFAVETDAGGTALAPTATVTSCDPAIATVVPTSDVPLMRTAFFVKGVAFGSTCVVASTGQLSDTMQVATFPASIVITGGEDTLLSGATATYGYEYRDARQQPLTGITPPTFSSSDTLRGKTQPSPLGGVLGLSPGVFTLTVRGVGSPPGGITGTKIILVEPGAFLGGVSPSSGDPGDVITVTNAPGGPGFDANTQASINGVPTFVQNVTVDEMEVIVPGMGVTGPVDLLMTQMGPQDLAQSIPFTSNTASLADPFDGDNNDPGSGPEITDNGDYFVVLSGACADGGGGPGTDCHDWFQITNTGGAAATVSLNVDWLTGADIDALMGSDADGVFAYDCEDGCAGASTNHPEDTEIAVPAGSTYYIWLNLYGSGGAPSSIARVRVTGLP